MFKFLNLETKKVAENVDEDFMPTEVKLVKENRIIKDDRRGDNVSYCF